jgi:hypothetical protein
VTAPRVAPRAKIRVLLSGEWLYGTVNRREFARATHPDEKLSTFKLTKRGWKGLRSVVEVVGSQVAAWEWQAPPAAAKRRRPQPKAEPPTVPAEISEADREALSAHMAGVRG